MTDELIAAPKSETEWYTGIAQAEEVIALSDAIDSGNWLEAGISAASLTSDAATMLTDPLGPLTIVLQAGMGWVMEHVAPLKQALDDLAGDPPVIKAYGETWKNVAERLTTVATQHAADVRADLDAWTGPASTAYRAAAAERVDAMNAAAKASATVGDAVIKAGGAVATIRMMVRETISTLVAALVTALLPPGGGTAKAVGMIAKAGSKISRLINKLLRSLSKLSDQLNRLAAALGRLLRRLRGKPGSGASPAPRPHTVGTPPRTETPSGGTTPSRAGGDGPDTPGTRPPPRTGDGATTTPSGAGPAYGRPSGGQRGLGKRSDWLDRTNPRTGRPFEDANLTREVELVRRDLLRSPDVGRVQRELGRLGVPMDRTTIARIKQYNFDSPGLRFDRDNLAAWRRLASGNGTVDDARYLVHEERELRELSRTASNGGFDPMGRHFDEMTARQQREWRADFDRAYPDAHGVALKAEYDFLADRIERLTNGQVRVPPMVVAAADSRVEARNYLPVDGKALKDHHMFEEWSRRADERVTISRNVQERLGPGIGPNPTVGDLLAAVKRVRAGGMS